MIDIVKAAIVGLGQVGMLFDEEPERQASGEIWTHFTAYERLSEYYSLVAAVEPDISRHSVALRRKPSLRIYTSVEEMLNQEELDVISICTPDNTHLEVLSKTLGNCRGVFLEKPVCTSAELKKSDDLLGRVRSTETSIRINYYKRQEPLVRQALQALAGQRIVNVAIKYSGPFSAVGSHALNLMLLFMPDAKLDMSTVHSCQEGNGYSGYFQSATGAMGQVLYCGSRHELVFEAEITTDHGLYRLERNLSRLRSYLYVSSSRYQGYRELEFQSEQKELKDNERFIGFLLEIAHEIISGQYDYTNLTGSLGTQKIMLEMEGQSH